MMKMRPLDDSWIPELVSLLGSSLSLIVMVIILAHYNNHPIFNWHGVTLNAIISVLSTTYKSWLIFTVTTAISQEKWIVFSRMRHRLEDFNLIDQAARGPLGSVLAIIRKVGGTGLVLGAIIVILSVALDPFSQQLIQIDWRLSFRDSTLATVPVAKRYSKGFRFIAAVADSGPSVSVTCDFSMQSAILFGLSNTQRSVMQQLQFSCPSGNCTWHTEQSLAICSKCQDVGNMVQLSKEPNGGDNSTLITTIRSANTIDAYGAQPGNLTKLALPNGLYIDNYDNMTVELQLTAVSTSIPQQTISFQSLDELLYSMSILRVTGDGVWPNVSTEATECALYYCVNEYTPNVENGFLNETIQQTSARRSPNSWQPILDSVAFEPPVNLSTLTSSDPLAYGRDAAINRTDLMIGDNFNISQTSVLSINSYLQSILAVNINTVLDLGYVLNTNVNGYVTNFATFGDPMQFKPSAMQAFSQSPNLTDLFSNIAQSMTNSIRAGADKTNSSSLVGKSGTITTYYSIQWPWISLLVTLVMAGYLVLFLVFYQSRKAQVPLWKSSSLPILAAGGRVQDQLQGLSTVSAMHRKAKTVYVRLLNVSPDDTDPEKVNLQSINVHSRENSAPNFGSAGSDQKQLLRQITV